MCIQTISQIDVCRIQIEESIAMYSDDKFISSITLSGAAEEILGKLVESNGELKMYDAIKGIINASSSQLHDVEYSKNEFNSLANGTRNSLKHYAASGNIHADFKQEAVNMLHRSIYNFESASGVQTQKMKQWLSKLDLHPKYAIKNA